MSITQITERELQLQRELEDAQFAGRLIVQRCDRLVAERDECGADAERYRWLFGARTAEECASEDVGLKPPLMQDLVLADLSGFYSHKELVDQMVDAAMKGKS